MTIQEETEIGITTDQRELLRLATAGSVDDGKSTLIGRLLLDTKLLLSDQLEAISDRGGAPDLAAITDGLRAEREQGITIDVAYRYFATPRRTFILADTPGHERYTRNMFTGTSTADLVIVLIDARCGRARPDPPSRPDRGAAAGPSRGRGGQQDGSGRLLAGALRGGERRGARARQGARPAGHERRPDLGARRRQRRRPLVADAVVRGRLAAGHPRDRRRVRRPRPRALASAAPDPVGGAAPGRRSAASTPASWPPAR